MQRSLEQLMSSVWMQYVAQFKHHFNFAVRLIYQPDSGIKFVGPKTNFIAKAKTLTDRNGRQLWIS